MSELKENILKLKAEGKSYNAIVAELGCAKSTVAYHCGEGQKSKTKSRTQAFRQTPEGLLSKRVTSFKQTQPVGKVQEHTLTPQRSLRQRVDRFQERVPEKPNDFSREDAQEKLGSTGSVCYLSGRSISLEDPSSYHLDHIVPRSQGGSNGLDNLGFATPEANNSKDRMTLEEYFSLCKDVLEYNGYKVTKL